METIGFYAFASIVIAMPVGLILFASSRAHRVCKSYTWPRVVALVFVFVYLLVTSVPFALYGSQWGMAWYFLTMPFSIVLEITAPMGFSAFASITTLIAASSWGTILYVVFAIVLLVRRRPLHGYTRDAVKVILFGASGMVGQGALRECLLDRDVESVLAIGRTALGQQDQKLREIVLEDLTGFDSIKEQLRGYDACLFCLGVSSAGMREADYRRVTYDLTMAAARTLASLNSGMTFIYVSGAGTDSSGGGRSMWARVKGETENALLGLSFKAAYMFRPGLIQPLHGIRSKTRIYRLLYAVLGPFIPLLMAMFPKYVTTTEQLGRAMIRVARQGFPKPVLESQDINAVH
jgi:hypothetical protein